MGLDGEQHDILRPSIRIALHGAHAFCVQLAAIFFNEPKSVGVDGLKVVVAGDEGDILPGGR